MYIVYSQWYTYSCVLSKSEGDAYPPPLSSDASYGWGLLNKQNGTKQTNKQTKQNKTTNKHLFIVFAFELGFGGFFIRWEVAIKTRNSSPTSTYILNKTIYWNIELESCLFY